jgi:hypothetical protein
MLKQHQERDVLAEFELANQLLPESDWDKLLESDDVESV